MLTRLITKKAKSVITLILCGVLASMPVAAQRFSVDGFSRSQPPMVLAQAGVESLDSAVARIRQRTGGRVLSAETRQEGGSVVHHIRILTKNGKVKNIKVVAQPR